MVYPTLHFDQDNSTTTICYNDTEYPKPFYIITVKNLKGKDDDIMLEWYIMTCALLNQYSAGWEDGFAGWEDGFAEGLYADTDNKEEV